MSAGHDSSLAYPAVAHVPVRVSGGIAVFTTTLSAGNHSLAAVFAPTNPVAFGPSASPPVPLTVRPLP
jgi:hypothetical protein